LQTAKQLGPDGVKTLDLLFQLHGSLEEREGTKLIFKDTHVIRDFGQVYSGTANESVSMLIQVLYPEAAKLAFCV